MHINRNINSRVYHCVKCIVAFIVTLVMVAGVLEGLTLPAKAAGTVYVSNWTEFKNALEEDSDTMIVVTHYITENSAEPYEDCQFVIDVKGNHTLDLNGHDIRIRTKTHNVGGNTEDIYNYYLFLFRITAGVKLRIIDNGNGLIKFHSYITGYTWDEPKRNLFLVHGGTLQIDGGNYEAGRAKTEYDIRIHKTNTRMSQGFIANVNSGGSMIINGGNFETKSRAFKTLMFYVDSTSSLTINDGYFDSRNGSDEQYEEKSNPLMFNGDGKVTINGGKFRLGCYERIALDRSGRTGSFGISSSAIDFSKYHVVVVDTALLRKMTFDTAEEFDEYKKSNNHYEATLWVEPVLGNSYSGTKTINDLHIYYNNIFDTNLGYESIALNRGFSGQIKVDESEFRYWDNSTISYEWYVYDENSDEYKKLEDVNGITGLSANFLSAYASQSFVKGGSKNNGESFTIADLSEGEHYFKCVAKETLGSITLEHTGSFTLYIEDVQQDVIDSIQITIPNESKYVVYDDGVGYLKSYVGFSDFGFKATGTSGDATDVCFVDDSLKVENLTTGEVVDISGDYVLEMGNKYQFTIRLQPADGYCITSATNIEIPGFMTRTLSLSADDENGGWIVKLAAYCKAPYFIDSVQIPLDSSVYNADQNRLIPGDNTATVGTDSKYYSMCRYAIYEDGNCGISYGGAVEDSPVGKIKSGSLYYFEISLMIDSDNRKTENDMRFSETGTYYIGNSRCTAKVSADGYRVDLKSGIIPTMCNHVSDEWITDSEQHSKQCDLCGEYYAKDYHNWDDGVVGDGITTYTCQICGDTKVVVDSLVHINKIVVNAQNPIAGEVIKEPTLADDTMAEIVSFRWDKRTVNTDTNKVELETAKVNTTFELGYRYDLQITVKAKEGYYLDNDTIISTYYLGKDYVWMMQEYNIGIDTNYQLLNGDKLSTVFMSANATMALSDTTIKLPTVNPGDTYESFLTKLDVSVTNSMGIAYTYFYKNGVVDAYGQKSGNSIVFSNTVSGTDIPYNGNAATKFEENTSYTIKIDLASWTAAVVKDRITISGKGNSLDYKIIETSKGPELIVTYGIESKTIGSVNLSGAVVPEFGQLPTTEGITAYEKVTIVEKSWSLGDNSDIYDWNQTMPFTCGGAYTLSIKVKPRTGFNFADSVTAAVNGAEAKVVCDADGKPVKDSDGSITVQYTFSKMVHLRAVPMKENEVAATSAYEGGYDLVTRCSRCNEVLNSEHVNVGKLHTITILESGLGTASASISEAAKGTVVQLSATPKEGYALTSWEVLSGGVGVGNNKVEVGSKDIVIKPIFTPINSTSDLKSYTSVSVFNDGRIELNFYIYLTFEEAEQAHRIYWDTRREVYDYYGGDISNLKVDGMGDDEGNYYKVSVALSAKEMTNQVYVSVYFKDYDNSYHYKESVASYCEKLLADASKSKYHDYAKALLNYGYSSQQYFKYSLYYPANDISGMSSSDRVVNIPKVSELPAPTLSVVKSSGFDKLDYCGSSLVTDSYMALNVYLTAGSGLSGTGGINIDSYNVTVKDSQGKLHTDASIRSVDKSGGACYINIPNISLLDIDEVYTIYITDKSTKDTMTITYSAMDYVRAVLEGAEQDMNFAGNEEYGRLVNLVAAIYQLSVKADLLTK